MYMPSHFSEERIEVLHALIQAHPLAALVSLQDGELEANHIPFLISAPTAEAPHGVLRCHVARNNPVWQSAASSQDALLIFQGAQAYISPRWYEEKQRSGSVVPTYNYAVVHAHGPMRIVEDRQEFLRLLSDLSDNFERKFDQPWKVSDAPAEYVDRMMDMIVGIEIPVRRISGKWKTSQNKSTQDRVNMVDGLREKQDPASHALADVMEQQLFESE
ncbi:FMN-binding negative transcriptional regulator [Undibacterium umbellatum]|uniref:FMN-binding negative transcriptional regulator n=1 Tax=Undibacterium umbellatum TaxID=2762300 RepID=A0ABR6ZBZ4_9BURK|nr:FMN-binding negative transcriptional regulator [Undibacterium umbellatum]MBC3909274.1 FMN-binding negative transcriptional regulator [Undibacterium umbellatum]